LTIHPGSSELLAAIPRLFEGVAVRVLGSGPDPDHTFGSVGSDTAELRADLPGGQLVASVPRSEPALHDLVGSLLATVAERERLESDMESMNSSAMRLMEQVSMFGETLPRLSAGGDDAEIALLGARACHRAAEVQHVIYLGFHASKGSCEVVVHCRGDQSRQRPKDGPALDAVVPVEGFLDEVMKAEGVVLRDVPAGGRLGDPGSPEHLAQHQIMGVPVTYGAGDKRVTLGALLLIDKVATYGSAGNDEAARLDNVEGQLAESFAAMLGAVLGARKTAELGKELSMARTIQHQILPERPAVLRGFDIDARYFACGAVGGDYFDYVPLADGRTLVVVADVSGHNLASGMIMVGARSMLRTLASVHDGPKAVFDALAARMYEDLTRTERFLTAAAVALRGCDGAVDYVSAGHNDLLVYRAATDRVEAVASESTILGFLPAPDYPARTLQLQPGDCLLLYTDGITEAMDETGAMFGDDRLAAVFAQLAPNRSAHRIIDGVMHELDRFRKGQVGTDDVTAVVIRYHGATSEGDSR
jgi:Stage II sporulation protein E (SpoIIE)